MAHFIELKNEVFGDEKGRGQRIDVEKIDAYEIVPLKPFSGNVKKQVSDAYVVNFKSRGSWMGSAVLIGSARACDYAKEIAEEARKRRG